jgi:MFS family permease
MGGFAVLKQREFTYYLCARFFSTIAAQMLIIAVGWQVYHLTGRVIDLGLIGLSQFLPFLCLSLFAGHVADRYDRGLIVRSCLAVFLISTLLLLVFAAHGLRSTVPIFGVLGILGGAILRSESGAYLGARQCRGAEFHVVPSGDHSGS